MQKKQENLLTFFSHLSLIKYPYLTKKTLNLSKINKYTFIVDCSLKKLELFFLFEKLLKTNIISINTCILPVKLRSIKSFVGKKPQYKKVILTLNKNEKIFKL